MIHIQTFVIIDFLEFWLRWSIPHPGGAHYNINLSLFR